MFRPDMEIECVFFGPIQETTGTKRTTQTVQQGTTVAELITELDTKYDDFADQLLTNEREIRDSMVVTINKRHCRYLDGELTELSDGDTVRITTSVQGG